MVLERPDADLIMDQSLFASDALHEREIELADGTKHMFQFRELTSAKFSAYQDAERSKDPAVRETGIARLIAASICEPDGKPSMSVEQAMKLKPAVAVAMFSEIIDLNGFVAKKASAPETASGSGTS